MHPIPEVIEALSTDSSLSLSSQYKLVIPTQTDPDIFCISRVLESSPKSLLEFSLSGQVFSASSLTTLSIGLKSNHNLTKFTLNSMKFLDLSSFYKLSEALTLNEALTYIDLSKNSLPDSTSNSLLELLGVLPYLNYLNLDYNRLTDISWGNILAVNTSLEQLFVNYNSLRTTSVENILESLVINKTLKILGLLGCEVLQKTAPLLASILKSASLQSLSIELDLEHEAIHDLAGTLCEYNNDLVEFNIGEEWKQGNEAIDIIVRAVKANRWISLKLADPAADYEIEQDFQEILELKLSRLKELEQGPVEKNYNKADEQEIHESSEGHEKVEKSSVGILEPPKYHMYNSGNKYQLDHEIDGLEKAEDELIAQVYNSVPEEQTSDVCEKSLISTSMFNDSPRNFMYSESSNTGTPVLESPRLGAEKEENKEKYKAAIRNIHKNMKFFDDKYLQVIESMKSEFFKEMNAMAKSFTESNLKLEGQIEEANKKNQDNLKKSEKKANKSEAELKKIVHSFELRIQNLEK